MTRANTHFKPSFCEESPSKDCFFLNCLESPQSEEIDIHSVQMVLCERNTVVTTDLNLWLSLILNERPCRTGKADTLQSEAVSTPHLWVLNLGSVSFLLSLWKVIFPQNCIDFPPNQWHTDCGGLQCVFLINNFQKRRFGRSSASRRQFTYLPLTKFLRIHVCTQECGGPQSCGP